MEIQPKFIDDFIEHSESEDLNEKTKKNRREVLQLLKNYLEEENENINLDGNQIKVKNKVERFFDQSPKSAIPPYVHAVTSFFEYLEEKENFDTSNVEDCKKEVLKIKREDYDDNDAIENIEKGLLNYDERESLLRACRKSDREPLKKEVMLKLILEAGLSRSELLTLKPEDIEWDSEVNPAVINVSSEWSQTKGEEDQKYDPDKDEKDETKNVAISLETRTRIKELIDREDRIDTEESKNYLLWENPNYRKPKRRLEEIFEVAEEFDRSDLSFKDLQRNVIVDLIEKEVPQHNIQDYFGSKSAVTSEVVKKFSLEKPSNSPIAYNKRIF